MSWYDTFILWFDAVFFAALFGYSAWFGGKVLLRRYYGWKARRSMVKFQSELFRLIDEADIDIYKLP